MLRQSAAAMSVEQASGKMLLMAGCLPKHARWWWGAVEAMLAAIL